MELKEAKDIVRQLAGESMSTIAARKDDVDYSEAIRMVCAAPLNDEEARIIQGCIPNDMAYMGLYPHIMKTFDIKPDGFSDRGIPHKILDTISEQRKDRKKNDMKQEIRNIFNLLTRLEEFGYVMTFTYSSTKLLYSLNHSTILYSKVESELSLTSKDILPRLIRHVEILEKNLNEAIVEQNS